MKRGFCWAGRLRSIVDRLASRNAPLVALAATTVWVAGCDAGPSVALLNGTGQPIVVYLDRPRGPVDVKLRPGGSRVITGLDVNANGNVALSAGACRYEFSYPRMGGLNYAWSIPDGHGGSVPDYRYPFPLHVLLAPDFRLYLPAAGSGKHGAPRPDPMPMHGFPMNPVSKTCR